MGDTLLSTLKPFPPQRLSRKQTLNPINPINPIPQTLCLYPINPINPINPKPHSPERSEFQDHCRKGFEDRQLPEAGRLLTEETVYGLGFRVRA